MTTNARLRTSVLAALAAVAGVLGLLAGPAGAQTTSQTSGGALATNNSVGSGTCTAAQHCLRTSIVSRA